MQAARATSSGPAEALQLLQELESAHAGVLREIEAMRLIQESAGPSPDQWAYARWKLSHASRHRRACVERVYAFALAYATRSEQARLQELQAKDASMLATSRDHVGKWTPDRITADWAGYCAASATIRRGMTDRIAVERTVLAPILSRIASS